MDDLGYVPNMTARNLGKRISSAIGVILPPLDSKERLGNPFYLEIMEAINEEARLYDMTTAIATAKVLMYYWKTLKECIFKTSGRFYSCVFR